WLAFKTLARLAWSTSFGYDARSQCLDQVVTDIGAACDSPTIPDHVIRMSTIVVVGLEPLGLSVVRQLASHGRTLTCVAPASDIAIRRHEVGALDVRAVVVSSASGPSLPGDVMHSASLVILTEDRDGANVDLALRIRKSQKDLHLIV